MLEQPCTAFFLGLQGDVRILPRTRGFTETSPRPPSFAMGHLIVFIFAFTAGGIGGFAIARREYLAPEFTVQRDVDLWDAELASRGSTTLRVADVRKKP